MSICQNLFNLWCLGLWVHFTTRDKQILLGIPIVDSVKYLGVRMGNVTRDSAFAFPLAQAQRRAGTIASYGLSVKERIRLLKTWILLCVLLTARAYFPTAITVTALKQVYHTALGVDRRGVTLLPETVAFLCVGLVRAWPENQIYPRPPSRLKAWTSLWAAL